MRNLSHVLTRWVAEVRKGARSQLGVRGKKDGASSLKHVAWPKPVTNSSCHAVSRVPGIVDHRWDRRTQRNRDSRHWYNLETRSLTLHSLTYPITRDFLFFFFPSFFTHLINLQIYNIISGKLTRVKNSKRIEIFPLHQISIHDILSLIRSRICSSFVFLLSLRNIQHPIRFIFLR